MVEEYVVRDDEVDGMHDIKSKTLDDIITETILAMEQRSNLYYRELQNLIDYVIYPHTHEEITIYAMALKHRLEEK